MQRARMMLFPLDENAVIRQAEQQSKERMQQD